MKMAEINFNKIPLRALNISSRLLLSKLLNPHMELATAKHLCKDYRGLAEIIGFDHMDIKNFERSNDPTKKILEEWEANASSRFFERSYDPTVGNLIELLTTIERFDVIDDAQSLFERDAMTYLHRQQRKQEAPLQVAEISSNPVEPMMCEHSDILTLGDISLQYDPNHIGGEVSYYDAYVCYDEADAQFVYKLSEYLESPQIGIKLCIKDRDLAAGVSNIYEALVRIIEERCNRMLIILSPEFLQSEECKFQARYATGLAVAQRNRKLIPLVYKPCPIPQLLRFVSKVDFTKADVHEWIWKKLVISIKGTVSNNFALPSSSFCPSIYTVSQMASLEIGYSSYPLMLETPTISRSRSNSPQPSITFPPSLPASQPNITFPPSLPASQVIAIPTNQSSLASPSTSQSSTTSRSSSTSPSTSQSLTSLSTSQPAKGSSPVSRSRWRNKFSRFGLSLSSNSNNNSGNESSGFHSLTDEQVATSGEVFEERV